MNQLKTLISLIFLMVLLSIICHQQFFQILSELPTNSSEKGSSFLGQRTQYYSFEKICTCCNSLIAFQTGSIKPGYSVIAVNRQPVSGTMGPSDKSIMDMINDPDSYPLSLTFGKYVLLFVFQYELLHCTNFEIHGTKLG